MANKPSKLPTEKKAELSELQQLRARNKELAAAKKKLRQDRDTLLYKINAEKNKMVDADLQVERLAEVEASNKYLREQLDKIKSNTQSKQKQINKLTGDINTHTAKLKKLKAQHNQLLKQNDQLTVQLKHKDEIIAAAHDETQRVQDEIRSYTNSTSWKLTAPIRALINIVRR